MSQNYSGRVALIVGIVLVACLASSSRWRHRRRWRSTRTCPSSRRPASSPASTWSAGRACCTRSSARRPAASANLAEQVMKALKKRVDPNGMRNLIWRPQGTNRLEIQMPLSRDRRRGQAAQGGRGRPRPKLERTNIRRPGDRRVEVDRPHPPEFDKLAGRRQRQPQADLDRAGLRLGRPPAGPRRPRRRGRAKAGRVRQLKHSSTQTNLRRDELARTLALKGSREATAQPAQGPLEEDPERLAAIDAYQQATTARVRKGSTAPPTSSACSRAPACSSSTSWPCPPSRSQPPTIARPSTSSGSSACRRTARRPGARRYRWFEVDNPDEFKGSTEQYNDRDYVLARSGPKMSLDQRTGKWALTSARPVTTRRAARARSASLRRDGALQVRRPDHPPQPQADGDHAGWPGHQRPEHQRPITGGSGVITGGERAASARRSSTTSSARSTPARSRPAQQRADQRADRRPAARRGQPPQRPALLRPRPDRRRHLPDRLLLPVRRRRVHRGDAEHRS